MENQQNASDYEFDLKKYLNVVLKRKMLILGVFFIAVIVAVVVSFLAPKVYEITTTIQLGNIGGLLVSKEEAREKIFNQNYLLSIINELNLKTGIESLKKKIRIVNVNGTDLFTVKIYYTDFDMAFRINQAIVDPLITQWKNIYQERLSLINERLKELEQEIKNSEGDINRTQALISGVPNSTDISQSDISLRIILLQNTLPNYETNLNGLRNQRNGLKLSLVNARDFLIFDKPIRPEHPIAIDKKQNIINTGILSLVFGVILAFYLEYCRKNK